MFPRTARGGPPLRCRCRFMPARGSRQVKIPRCANDRSPGAAKSEDCAMSLENTGLPKGGVTTYHKFSYDPSLAGDGGPDRHLLSLGKRTFIRLTLALEHCVLRRIGGRRCAPMPPLRWPTGHA